MLPPVAASWDARDVWAAGQAVAATHPPLEAARLLSEAWVAAGGAARRVVPLLALADATMKQRRLHAAAVGRALADVVKPPLRFRDSDTAAQREAALQTVQGFVDHWLAKELVPLRMGCHRFWGEAPATRAAMLAPCAPPAGAPSAVAAHAAQEEARWAAAAAAAEAPAPPTTPRLLRDGGAPACERCGQSFACAFDDGGNCWVWVDAVRGCDGALRHAGPPCCPPALTAGTAAG